MRPVQRPVHAVCKRGLRNEPGPQEERARCKRLKVPTTPPSTWQTPTSPSAQPSPGACKRGLRVVEFSSGFELYSATLVAEPELVVLETQLDEMDGFQVFARLQRTSTSGRLRVLFVTRFEHPQVAYVCKQSGPPGTSARATRPRTWRRGSTRRSPIPSGSTSASWRRRWPGSSRAGSRGGSRSVRGARAATCCSARARS